MKEDLIKLKEKIEKVQYFVPICGMNHHIVIGGTEKSLSQIKEEENTNGIIAECEELMKNIIRFFNKHDVSCSSISITSYVSFFVKKSLSEKIKKEIKRVNGNETAVFKDQFRGNTLTRYVPVEFTISWDGCYLAEDFVPATVKSGKMSVRYLPHSTFEKTAKNIQEIKVSGIVDIEKFIKELTKMGYIVEDLDHRKITSYAKCMSLFLDTIGKTKNRTTNLRIRADLIQKEEEKGKVAVK